MENRFKYQKEMEFFMIKDKMGEFPTFFVDDKESAEKYITFFNTLNPKLKENKIIFDWKYRRFVNNGIFLNDEMMDRVFIGIQKKIYKTGEDILIKEKHVINPHHKLVNNQPLIEHLEKCKILKELLKNYSFTLNSDFLLILNIPNKTKANRDAITNEIQDFFPSLNPTFLQRPYDEDCYDLIIYI